MKSFVLFECKSKKSGEHLCYSGFRFSANNDYGRIESALFYHTPDKSQKGLQKHLNSQSWYKDPDGYFCMGINHFSLPPCLQGIGLGHIIWSEIFKGLPENVRTQLKLFGSLNSGDAFTPETADDRSLIHETSNGQQRIKLINQIQRRNHFWEGMLEAFDKKTPALSCDDKGNGAFRGYFKDPLFNGISKKIVLKNLRREDVNYPSLILRYIAA